MIRIEEIRQAQDGRGAVFEPIGQGDMAVQRNVHVVLTRPGGVRGNHYHQIGTEIMTVVGPALVRLREDALVRDVAVPDGAVYRITLPPGVSHAVQNTGTGTGLVVSFSTQAHDPTRPDVVRDLLIEPRNDV
jgi:UDP-2-acetamido-2,6-beta-L-arabino-hexul-4-ose reductase